MNVRRAAFFAVGLSCVSLLACQLIVGVKDEEGLPRPVATEDAGEDAGSPDPCVKKHPPPPPSAAELTEAAAGSPVVFAVRAFQINPPDTVVGYDLDDHCTGDPASTTAQVSCTSRAGADTTDRPNGVDNEFQRTLLPSFLPPKDGGPPDPAADNLNGDIAGGRRTVFIGLTDYNGLANDPEVQVGLAASERMALAGCGNCYIEQPEAGTFDDAGDPPRPRWDGLDAWYYTPNSRVLQGLPVANLHGYVSGGVLVVNGAHITVSLRGADLDFRDALLTATIAKDPGSGSYSLQDGVIAGRIPAAEVVLSASTLKNSLADCSNPVLAILKDEVCHVRDLPTARAEDGKGSTCESLSVAIGFRAFPARIGPKGPAAPALPCEASTFACE